MRASTAALTVPCGIGGETRKLAAPIVPNLPEEYLERQPVAEHAILRARAQALAREPTGIIREAGFIKVIRFLLAETCYAVEHQYVREVCPLVNLTPLPCTPSFVQGIINDRGEIRSVINLQCFLELPVKKTTSSSRVLILKINDLQVGILADAILGVFGICPNTLQASLPTLTGRLAEFLKGITADLTILLDVPKLLADKRILVQEEAPS